MNYIWDNIFRKTTDQNVFSVLRESYLFRDLSDSEIRFVERCVHVRHYHSGESVFRQGEVGVGMYLVAKGRIEIYVIDSSATSEENREIYVTQLLSGDFFGELSLVEENGRRTATAVAREEALLIGFFKPDLMEILSRRPAMGTKITLRLAEVLGRRLKETTEKVSELRRVLKELRMPPDRNEADSSVASAVQPPFPPKGAP
ncbi:MAG: cyclic nucleotide-binding domain-containing protein [Bdellovibrionales bacterium]|nr:cyclic nucleotide-binding domain-containing protein [Bdellovibrionales bacterium]